MEIPPPALIAENGVLDPDGFTLDGSDPSPVAKAIVTGLRSAASATDQLAGRPASLAKRP
jgi:hypothetical protein